MASVNQNSATSVSTNSPKPAARLLIREMISALAPKCGQQFSRDAVVEWFAQHYPKIKEGTISAHLIRFATNAQSRLHFGVRPDEDLLFQVDGSHFRLYDPTSDPPPIHSKADTAAALERAIECARYHFGLTAAWGY